MTATQGYTAISRRALDLEDYIDVARRHVAWIAGPLFAGAVISLCVAFFLKNIYESQAVMQITPAQISEELVRSTVNQQLNDRIVQMQSTIMSRTSLSNLIQDPHLKLYPEELAKGSIEDVIELMRRDITISIGPATERRGASTFAIRFQYNNRLKAMNTVQALVTRFIDENTNTQRSQQTFVKDFFGDELTQAKADLAKRAEELTKFRNLNQGRLPEQSQLNMSALSSLQTQVNGMNDQLNRLAEDRVTYETHLSSLRAQMEMNNALAQDPQSAPPVAALVRQNEELAHLNGEIGGGELRLQGLLLQYRETYPDIRDLKNNLGVLKNRRDEILAKQAKQEEEEAARPKEAPKKVTNVALARAQADLQQNIDATNAMLKNNETERQLKLRDQGKLNLEIEAYRGKLAATSNIEAQYADLNRDYNNAAGQYQETLRKKELTAQGSELIQKEATEKLAVLDPPSLPAKPSKPNRWQIVGIGIGISLMLGIALAGVQEARDTSLKNLKDVRAYTNLPVLSSIPLLENTLLVKRKKRITYLFWSAAIVIGMIAVGVAVFYYLTVTAIT